MRYPCLIIAPSRVDKRTIGEMEQDFLSALGSWYYEVGVGAGEVTLAWTRHERQLRGIKPLYHHQHLTATVKSLALPTVFTLTTCSHSPVSESISLSC